MQYKGDTKKFFFYIFIFIPLILIGLEIFFTTLNKIRGVNITKTDWSFKYDQLNGWRGIKKQNEFNQYEYLLNKHSLFQTPFQVNSTSKKTTTGILISGNSFASGGFEGNGEKNKNAFFSKLETRLRAEQLEGDVVNISFP